MLVLVQIGLGDLAIGFAQVCEHLQAGDLPESQGGILKLLEEGDWSGCDELVMQGFSTSWYSWKSLQFSP